MKIDSNLNLVLPVERNGTNVFIHASPISRETFERYYSVLSKTFTATIVDPISGPRVAALALKDIAKRQGIWELPAARGTKPGIVMIDDSVKNGLLNEIRRLANVIAPTDKGWSATPLQDAVDSGYFDDDDAMEVENALVFFLLSACG